MSTTVPTAPFTAATIARDPGDLGVAWRAALACRTAVERELTFALDVDAKTAPTDLVTNADRAGEAAAAAVLSAERPDDDVRGEEGSRSGPGGSRQREWLIDPVDGTLNLVRGLSGWACVIGLVTDGEPQATVILDPIREEAFVALRGHGAFVDGRRLRVRADATLEQAVVATHLDPVKRRRPAVRTAAHRLLDRAGAVRAGAGSGSLELAWLAAGRIDGWIQPDVAPWDWLPGSLLVREAGGTAVACTPRPDGPTWAIAGTAIVVDELRDLIG